MTIDSKRSICGGLALVVLANLAVASTASASMYCKNVTSLFCEDFEGYTSFSNSQNPGLPLVSEGAKGTWYGGRMAPGEGTIDSDLAVLRLPSVYPNNVTFGQFQDDAGLLFRVSTVGIANPVLSFQWKTHNTESTDRFTAGYYLGNINFVNDTPDGGPNENLIHRFDVDGPAWSNWTQLLSDRNENSWSSASYPLPANKPDMWVAFWMNNGNGDMGKVDNILVTPEPSTAALALLGVVAACHRRRRARA